MAILAGAYAGLSAMREARVQDIYWADEFLGSRILSERKLDAKLSYITTREVLTRCIVTRSSTWFTLISEEKQAIITKNCQRFAEAVYKGARRHAEAHLILAERAIFMGEMDSAQTHMQKSAEAAPLDRFNVEWRLILTDRLLSLIPSANIPRNCASRNLPESATLKALRVAQSPVFEVCA